METFSEEQAQEMRSLLGQQSIGLFQEHMGMIKRLCQIDQERRGYFDSCMAVYYPFMYGYILGKKTERDRRKQEHGRI